MKFLTRTAATLLLVLSVNSAQAGIIFVGDWFVQDGPDWFTNPATLTGQETAALLFGGDPLDYLISTMGVDPGLINNSTWIDEFGVGPSIVAHNLVVDNGDGLYNSQGDQSAYVGADRCTINPDQCHNFAFRAAVPEPATLLLMGLGLAGIGYRRHRSK